MRFKYSISNEQRGSILLLVLILSSGILISMLFLSTTLRSLMNQQRQKFDRTTITQALHSSLDYTVTALKQNWCMTTTWAKNLMTCDLTSPYNLERLTLSDYALGFISRSSMVAPTPFTNTRLLKVGPVETTLAAISTEHPLFSILVATKSFGVTKIRFLVERIEAVQFPYHGREVPLKISIEFLGSDNSILPHGKIESVIYIFPREVGTNALMLANNLYLNGESDIELDTPGNSQIKITSAGTTGKGLYFDSPVFINGNIVIPDERAAPNAYSNVTFADKVILGGGIVYRNTDIYVPLSAGGKGQQFHSEERAIGGFLGGIEMDPARDRGLDVFGGIINTGADLSDFNLCRKRQLAKVDLTNTRDAQTWMRINGPALGALYDPSLKSIDVTLNLGRVNQFLPQDLQNKSSFSSNPALIPNPVVNNPYSPLLRVWVNFLGFEQLGGGGLPNSVLLPSDWPLVSFELSRGGSATIDTGNGSSLVVRAIGFVANGNVQDHALNIQVSWDRPDLMPMGTIGPSSLKPIELTPSIQIQFESFDLGYAQGKSTREMKRNPPPTSSANQMASDTAHYYMDKWKTNGFRLLKTPTGFNLVNNSPGVLNQYFTCPDLSNVACSAVGIHYFESLVAGYNVLSESHRYSDDDLASFDLKCGQPPFSPSEEFPSFESADWSVSFSDVTRTSWAFAGLGLGGNGENSVWTGFYDGQSLITDTRLDPKFRIHSIVKECIVKSTANFVTGFFACDKFIIEARNTPLRIIGTVIAGKLIVAESAIDAGIHWSSIYNTNAISELRSAAYSGYADGRSVLKYNNDASSNCEDPANPLWIPYPSLKLARGLLACNPVALRAKADPFKWSTVDPDCGPLPGLGIVTCKGRITRWTAREIYRVIL